MGLCRRFCCSRGPLLVLFLASAVPLGVIFSLERTKNTSETFEYRSRGWIRECAKWDADRRRFLVSTFFDGGVAQIPLPGGAAAPPDTTLEEQSALHDPAVAGNASVGILVDAPRRRLLVVYSDLLRHRYSALAAYDLSSWRRLFLAQLSGPNDEPSDADDVTVDGEGNAYVTDAKANKLWKIGVGGELLGEIRSSVGLNGIVYHPNGYLLVVHTFGGQLFRVDPSTAGVEVVQVTGGSLLLGDGLELLSPTRLVVAGTPSGRFVERGDDWRTAAIAEIYRGPMHRIASSATVKDGKVFLSHLIGGGCRRGLT
ncbi:unnamed protein product [Spirodela intermedia]|uniref:Uncharacterized protein n=1 Tax=Spirodela intermedia TaxID=51605 RepID=A0A7I8IWN6_SPIIN|nr:unnamed protein product [Spirodela intermedia]CAA6662004.1 unnamed protein product [Spirodela intermedia]